MPCSCKYCANCACVRAKTPCTQKCHGSNGDAGCQNTEEFIKCNQMSVKDVKKALGAAGLSIIGNKKELVTLLAQHLRANAAPLPSSSAMSSSSSAGGSEARSYGTEALMQAIMACGDNYSQILSLGGTPITRQSPHAHMRKAYLALSRRVHPDKNGQSKQSKEAFQQVRATPEQCTTLILNFSIFDSAPFHLFLCSSIRSSQLLRESYSRQRRSRLPPQRRGRKTSTHCRSVPTQTATKQSYSALAAVHGGAQQIWDWSLLHTHSSC